MRQCSGKSLHFLICAHNDIGDEEVAMLGEGLQLNINLMSLHLAGVVEGWGGAYSVEEWPS